MSTPKLLGPRLTRNLLLALLPVATGCLSPQALQPLAQQNRTNIANYGANVQSISNALRKEVALHAALQMHRARTTVTDALVNIRKTILPSNPTSNELTDTAKQWYTGLKTTVDTLAEKLEAVSGDKRAAVADSLARDHPAAIDIALGTPGFSIARVLQDSVVLDELNGRIRNEPNGALRQALVEKRNAVVAPYRAVIQERELIENLLVALDEYLTVLKDQTTIAATHADAILAYAEGRPALSSLRETLQHEELRSTMLNFVERRKGKESAKRLGDRLSQFDEIVEILEGIGAR